MLGMNGEHTSALVQCATDDVAQVCMHITHVSILHDNADLLRGFEALQDLESEALNIKMADESASTSRSGTSITDECFSRECISSCQSQ
jgi:hypothetical protein